MNFFDIYNRLFERKAPVSTASPRNRRACLAVEELEDRRFLHFDVAEHPDRAGPGRHFRGKDVRLDGELEPGEPGGGEVAGEVDVQVHEPARAGDPRVVGVPGGEDLDRDRARAAGLGRVG